LIISAVGGKINPHIWHTGGSRNPRTFIRAQYAEKEPVGAISDRPWILLPQNPSPQGENKVIFLRKIRKTAFFGGRSMIAPTFSEENMVSQQF
jgi:putative intracellular protease/amidase